MPAEACPASYLSCDGKCLNPAYQCDGVIDCTETYLDELIGCPGEYVFLSCTSAYFF